MIRIRYACLPEGLHATAVARSRHTTIYLRPGLEPWQRRDALQRLRRNARLGYAPPLPALPLARALLADQVLSTFRTLLAALQCHPLGALGLAGMLAGAAVSYMTLVTCPPQSGSTGPAGTPAPVAGQAGGTGLVTADLVPLATKPGHWRVPEARPRKPPASGGAATRQWHPAAGERRARRAGRWPRHWPGRGPRAGGQWWQRYGWLWERRPPAGGAAAGRGAEGGGAADGGVPVRHGPQAGQPPGPRARRGWPAWPAWPGSRWGWPSVPGESGGYPRPGGYPERRYPRPGQYPERPAAAAGRPGCAGAGVCDGLPRYRKTAW